MEHVVIFVCICMHLPTVLRCSYTYDTIFITILKIKHKLFIASRSALLPLAVKNFGYCSEIVENIVISTGWGFESHLCQTF
jgi:hypothetical protein